MRSSELDPSKHHIGSTLAGSSAELTKRSPSLSAVVIPTTAAVIRIVDLRIRARLRTSYAALQGDFRPLGISEDYWRFLSGPMLELIDPGPYEITLSGVIDSGRSWELPVMIAHLLHARGALTGKLEDGQQPYNRLIWSTGKVDAHLAPLPDFYHLEDKLAASKDLFSEARKNGVEICLIVPRNLAGRDAAAARAAALEFRADLHEVASLSDVILALGLDHFELTDLHGTSANLPLPKRTVVHSNIRYRLLRAIGILAALLLAVSGYSIGFRRPANTLQSLVVDVLSAGSDEECQERIYATRILEAQPLASKDDTYSIKIRDGLCGLEFRNTGRNTIKIALDNRLGSYGILGDNPLFAGMELPANRSIPFYFARRPVAGSYKLILDTSADRTIEFVER